MFIVKFPSASENPDNQALLSISEWSLDFISIKDILDNMFWILINLLFLLFFI